MVESPIRGSPEEGPTIKQKLLELAASGLIGVNDTIDNFPDKNVQETGRSFRENFIRIQAIAEGVAGELTADQRRQLWGEAKLGILKVYDFRKMFRGESEVVNAAAHFEYYFKDLEGLATGIDLDF